MSPAYLCADDPVDWAILNRWDVWHQFTVMAGEGSKRWLIIDSKQRGTVIGGDADTIPEAVRQQIDALPIKRVIVSGEYVIAKT